jgi:putative peptidoglycan binding protein/trypsin-like peptidase
MKRPASPDLDAPCRLPALSVLGILACLALAGPPAAASVFGPDERVPLPQSLRPAAAKLGVFSDAASHSVCTAFCVAPDVVATAAHCLYRTSGEQPLRLSDLSFRLDGAAKAVRIAGAQTGAAEANVTSGSTKLKVHPPIDATRDWALVRLAQPACTAGVFKVSGMPVDEVMKLAGAGQVFNIAYHRDLPKWQPMLNTGCNVKRDFVDADWQTIRRDFSNPDQLLLHTCDTGAASSGSPLLVDGADGPEVVGINVGTYVQSKVIMLNGEVLHRFKSDDVANTGVNASAFATAFAAFVAADTLTERRDVRQLQEALAARGLYIGSRDGRFGPVLRASIEEFERASHMPVTGLATHTVLHALVGESDVVTGKIPGMETAAGR